MSDVVTLQLPRERDFFGVAHLVLGGLGARFDLTYDVLEDMTTALDELMDRRESTEEVTLEVCVEDGALTATVGPVRRPRRGRAARVRRGARSRRVLETVVDGVSVSRRDGGALGRAGEAAGEGARWRVTTASLLRRYHEEGDVAAREQLIEQYMSLVRSLARRYSYRGEQLEDLVQIGAIGLIKAIDRFDLSRGVELTTYATPNIIGEIKRHFRDKGWSVRVPRGLQELTSSSRGSSSN